MQYKTVSFSNKKFKFNRGINAISTDDYNTFDILASPLMNISKLYDNSLVPFFDCDIIEYMPNVDVTFSFQDGSRENILFDFYRNNSASSEWLYKNRDLINCINTRENIKPIFAYYRKGNCIYQDAYCTHHDYDLKNFYTEREWYPWKEYNKEFNFFSKLAIDAKYGKKDEYSICHYNHIKMIIDEILAVTYSENFDFSIDAGKFVYCNNSRYYNIANESYDIGITVGMIMQLYIGCLSKKEEGFIGFPCDCSGIVICNYDFGERPSYSDKKWEYYKIFSKYFPKMQFIVC